MRNNMVKYLMLILIVLIGCESPAVQTPDKSSSTKALGFIRCGIATLGTAECEYVSIYMSNGIDDSGLSGTSNTYTVVCSDGTVHIVPVEHCYVNVY